MAPCLSMRLETYRRVTCAFGVTQSEFTIFNDQLYFTGAISRDSSVCSDSPTPFHRAPYELDCRLWQTTLYMYDGAATSPVFSDPLQSPYGLVDWVNIERSTTYNVDETESHFFMNPLPWYLTVFQGALYFTAFDHPAREYAPGWSAPEYTVFAHYTDVGNDRRQSYHVPRVRPGATALFYMDVNHRVTKLLGSHDFSLYVVSCLLWLAVQCLMRLQLTLHPTCAGASLRLPGHALLHEHLCPR